MTAPSPDDRIDGAASLEPAGADASPLEAASGLVPPIQSDAPEPPQGGRDSQGMIPGRARRRTKLERVAMRILATGGIIGIAVALGAILGANEVDGWLIGLVVGLTAVVLAAVLWSSRQL